MRFLSPNAEIDNLLTFSVIFPVYSSILTHVHGFRNVYPYVVFF